MRQIVFLQIQSMDDVGELNRIKNEGDSSLAVTIWLFILVFLIGVIVGWFLHRHRAKKYKHRTSRRKKT